MNKTRLFILPIIVVFFAFIMGWSTISAQTIDKLTNQYREIEALPSGSVFTLVVTDDDMTAAAEEYLSNFRKEIEAMVQEAAGVKLTLSDPVVEISTTDTVASVKVGKGFLKVNASIRATITWDGSLHVNVTSVDVPIVSVDPATINSYIQGPINNGMAKVAEYYEIRSLQVGDGAITVEAMKK